MKIALETVTQVVADYDYTDNCQITELENGDITLEFTAEQAQMDLIYAVSGIVQDIISANCYPNEYADYPYVDLSENTLKITFKNS